MQNPIITRKNLVKRARKKGANLKDIAQVEEYIDDEKAGALIIYLTADKKQLAVKLPISLCIEPNGFSKYMFSQSGYIYSNGVLYPNPTESIEFEVEDQYYPKGIMQYFEVEELHSYYRIQFNDKSKGKALGELVRDNINNIFRAQAIYQSTSDSLFIPQILLDEKCSFDSNLEPVSRDGRPYKESNSLEEVTYGLFIPYNIRSKCFWNSESVFAPIAIDGTRLHLNQNQQVRNICRKKKEDKDKKITNESVSISSIESQSLAGSNRGNPNMKLFKNAFDNYIRHPIISTGICNFLKNKHVTKQNFKVDLSDPEHSKVIKHLYDLPCSFFTVNNFNGIEMKEKKKLAAAVLLKDCSQFTFFKENLRQESDQRTIEGYNEENPENFYNKFV